MAVRAANVAPVASQENADPDFVLLGLQPVEEAVNAGEVVVAVKDEVELVLG